MRKMTREEYETLAVRLSPKLLQAANRLTYPDHALAEDLVQTALVRGYEMMLAGRFEAGPGSLSWFLRGITTDFLAHLREHRRCIPHEPEHHVLMNQVDERTLAAPLGDGGLDSGLAAALDALPAEQRVCLELVDLAECSYQDAARQLGLPIGTVRSRLSRARLFVAAHLSRQEKIQ